MISIVTGTKDRPESFERFVNSVHEHTEHPYELVVADASEGERYVWEPNKPRREFLGLKHLYENPPLGTLRGYNAAFRQCTQEFVVWFNDDAELLPGWDREAVLQMNAAPDVGMGIIYFRDHDMNGFQVKFKHQHYFDVPVPNFGFVRREVGEKLGWFDESLGNMYGCDTDFGMQMIVSGYGVMPLWGCRCLHYRVMDQQRSENLSRIRYDREKFDAKWAGRKEEVKAAFRPWVKYLRPSECD